MNEGLAGLERQEGEMTEFSVLGELPLLMNNKLHYFPIYFMGLFPLLKPLKCKVLYNLQICFCFKLKFVLLWFIS